MPYFAPSSSPPWRRWANRSSVTLDAQTPRTAVITSSGLTPTYELNAPAYRGSDSSSDDDRTTRLELNAAAWNLIRPISAGSDSMTRSRAACIPADSPAVRASLIVGKLASTGRTNPGRTGNPR